MFKIDGAGVVNAMPARGGIGTPGWFTQNAAGGPGTTVTGEWLNMVQAELLAVLTAAGVIPDKANDGQILAAIEALIASAIAGIPHGVAMVIATGNFVVPAGVTQLDVELWGGGGGGNGAPQTGGGGAGGGYARKLCTVVPGQIISCTIGGGGTPGGPGGTTSFGALVSATGGGKGNNGGSSDTPGTGVGGDINLSGAYGGIYLTTGTSGSVPGAGGGSPLGGSGTPATSTGAVPGSGGGGGTGGDSGAAGLIIVRW